MRGEGEAEFVNECLLMNRACIIGMQNVLFCNVGVCVNFNPARVLEDYTVFDLISSLEFHTNYNRPRFAVTG